MFPEFHYKTIVLENIVSPSYILGNCSSVLKDLSVEEESLNIITACRLSIYTKGLDRIILALRRLIDNGYNVKWYIIGDGPDRKEFEEMIIKNNLENYLFLLGQKDNPYPYIKRCDVYVMPSRYEGKPIAVTEAQILGLPVIVTNYSSASEQVMNEVDGLVVNNDDHSIYDR